MSKQWPPRLLSELRNGLNLLASSVQDERTGRTDDEQVWLTRFLVIRICGYLEQVVNETIRGYIGAKSGGPVRAFAHSWLEKSKNPSTDNMLELVGRLDATLAEDLQNLLHDEDKRLHREISLLVDRRHKIAHGLNEGLTPTKALSLKLDAERVADWFITSLNPDRMKSK